MKKNYGLENVKDLLDGVTKNLGVERGLNQTTLFNFWKNAVGPRFKENSKAISVTNKNGRDILIVATSSSVVSQELSLYKRNIIKKLYPVAKSLKYNISDIIFSTKMWSEVTNKQSVSELSTLETYEREPTQKELDEIELPDSIVQPVKDSIDSQKFDTEDIKERILTLIIKDLKTQIWKKNNGFPFCSKCGIPVNYRYFNKKDILCPACKYS